MSINLNNSFILCEQRDAICTITLNQPKKRNALSSETLAALQQAFNTIASDNSIKVIILTGNGPVFSSGHDLNEIRKDSSLPVMKKLFKQCSELMLTMKKQPQPIIAQVSGAALAAGCQLVCNCDLAIAADTAKFALPGSAIGLFCSTPAVAVSRVANTKHTMEMLLMGEAISAHDAFRFGLINKVTKIENLEKAVNSYATKITESSSTAISIGKKAFYQQLNMGLDQAYDFASNIMAENMQEIDAQEGIDSFLNKRQPQWKKR